MDYFNKDIKDLNWRDITAFSAQLQSGAINKEGFYLELKKEPTNLATWSQAPAGKRKLSKDAKGQLLKEICAFANSDGGILVLGIDELNFSTHSIPDVETFSDRLSQLCSDVLDPPLRHVKIQHVVETGDEGIIVIEIPASNKAPHRLNARDLPSAVRGQAYIRNKSSSTPASMSQIHDIVRLRDLGVTNYEKRITSYQEKIAPTFESGEKRFELGFKAIPEYPLHTVIPSTPCTLAGKLAQNNISLPIGSYVDLGEFETEPRVKPILRGREWIYLDRIDSHRVVIRFFKDGSFELVLEGGRRELNTSKLRLRNIIGAVCWITNILKLYTRDSNYSIISYISQIRGCITQPENSNVPDTRLITNSGFLPRYSYSHVYSANDFINDVLSDIFDFLGIEHPDFGIEFTAYRDFWNQM